MKFKKIHWHIIIIVLLSILILYILVNYLNFKNKNPLFSQTITSINFSYENLIKEKKYDFQSAYPVSKTSLIRLNSLREKYDPLLNKYNDYFQISDLYKEFFTNFNGLNNKSIASSDYIKNLTAAENALEQLNNYYALNENNISEINYFTSFYNYNNRLLTSLADSSKESLNSDISNSIQVDYTSSMNNIYENLLMLSQDLKPALTYCYESKGALKNILNDVYRKQGDLENIKNYISEVSVPQDQYSSYQELNSIITISSSYLENMKEILTSQSLNPSYDKVVSDIYGDAFSKRDELITALDNYKKKYSNIIK